MKAEDTELLKEFTPEQVAKLTSIIEKHKGKAGGLIPVLEEAQVCLEYLPLSVQKKIAAGLNLPLSRVYGVVTFYSFFTMTPRGKHTVRVCLGTACYVRGGKALTETLEKQFGIKEAKQRKTGCSRWNPSAAWAPADWDRSSLWMTTCMAVSNRAK